MTVYKIVILNENCSLRYHKKSREHRNSGGRKAPPHACQISFPRTCSLCILRREPRKRLGTTEASIVLAPPVTFYCMARWQCATRTLLDVAEKEYPSAPSSHGGHWDANRPGRSAPSRRSYFAPNRIRDRFVQVPTERSRVVEIGERATEASRDARSLFRFRSSRTCTIFLINWTAAFSSDLINGSLTRVETSRILLWKLQKISTSKVKGGL